MTCPCRPGRFLGADLDGGEQSFCVAMPVTRAPEEQARWGCGEGRLELCVLPLADPRQWRQLCNGVSIQSTSSISNIQSLKSS